MVEVTHTVSFKAVAVTAQQDLFEIKNGTTGTCRIHGFVLSQETEISDAQEEQLRITMNRAQTSVASGSGGTTATPLPRRRGDPAFTGTVEVNNTTQLAMTSPDVVEPGLEIHTWNVRVPYVFWYPPEARPLVLPGDYWTIRLETTPADSITMSGTVFLEQV
jgi:hypothetical protein